MEKTELENLDISCLIPLYQEQSKRLNQSLLDGTSWEELTDQRKYVTTIGVVIDAKKEAAKNALIAAALQIDLL
jgi:hypothetical protein